MQTKNRVIVVPKRFFAGVTAALLLCLLIMPVAAVYSDAAQSAYDNGVSLIREEQYAQAVVAFDRAITSESAFFEAWNAKADALNRDGQYAAALNASDQALAVNPSYTQGWINRGYILYNLGRYDEELLAYEKALVLEPENAEAWFNRGYSLAALRQYDEALRSFDKVAAIDPAYPNLEANRRIAEKNRDAEIPLYSRYAVWIIVAAIIIAYAGAVLCARIRKD